MNLSLVWQLSIVSSIIWQNLNYTLLCFDLIISYFLHSAEFYSCDHHKIKKHVCFVFFSPCYFNYCNLDYFTDHKQLQFHCQYWVIWQCISLDKLFTSVSDRKNINRPRNNIKWIAPKVTPRTVTKRTMNQSLSLYAEVATESSWSLPWQWQSPKFFLIEVRGVIWICRP